MTQDAEPSSPGLQPVRRPARRADTSSPATPATRPEPGRPELGHPDPERPGAHRAPRERRDLRTPRRDRQRDRDRRRESRRARQPRVSRDTRDTQSRETTREILRSRPNNEPRTSTQTSADHSGKCRPIDTTNLVPRPRPPAEPVEHLTDPIPAISPNTGADQAEWCYYETRKRGTQRRYTGQINTVSGPEGERVRSELAAVTRELLKWALEHREKDAGRRGEQEEKTRD